MTLNAVSVEGMRPVALAHFDDREDFCRTGGQFVLLLLTDFINGVGDKVIFVELRQANAALLVLVASISAVLLGFTEDVHLELERGNHCSLDNSVYGVRVLRQLLCQKS